MNRRTKAHFQYGWWVYILIIVAVITLWVSVFSQLAKPKPYEVLNITFVGSADDKNLKDDLQNALKDKTSYPLKKINVEVVSGKALNLAEIISMRCMGETDLIIFEEDYIVKPLSLNFKGIDGSKLNGYFNGATLYNEDEKTYGMQLYDGSTKTNFTKYYKGENKWWALITPTSENVAKINGIGEEKNDAALQAIKYLMEAV